MLVQTNPLQWPKEMQDEHEEVDKQTDRIPCFPTAKAPKDKPDYKTSTEMAASTINLGDSSAHGALRGDGKPTNSKQATREGGSMTSDERKRPSMGLREELTASDDMARSMKRQRRDLPLGGEGDPNRVSTSGLGGLSDFADHGLGMPSDLGTQILLGGQPSPALLSRLDSEVLPLHLQYQAQDALGINAARNAAMLASLSGQTRNARLDPLLLASPRLAGAGSQAWQIGNRFPPSQGMFAQGAASNFASPFVEQEHAALLRLNALQGDLTMLDAPSRLSVSLGSSLFRDPISGSLLRQPQPSTDSLAGGLLAGVYGGVSGATPGLSSASSFGGSLSGVQDLLSSSDASLRAAGTRTASLTGENVPQGISPLSHLPLPPSDDVAIAHYRQRSHVPLATDEDQNWLSEFLCFVRLELVEIFRANSEDVRSRNSSKKVIHGQVGIRCRYCAHLPLGSRASRSSSYPSSLSRIYQSLTMMLRDHFGKCDAIPPPLKQRFLELKGKTSQGATDSKHYWVYSAMKRGLVDSQSGIWVRDSSQAIEPEVPPFGTTGQQSETHTSSATPVVLVASDDRQLVSEFLYTLMTQVQRVTMEESERTGNRKSLSAGLPGVGCRHCCQSNRKGLCRLFPVRRRTLPNKINDLYEHIRRCSLCPPEMKDRLALLRQRDAANDRTAGEKEFFDRIWARMGHGSGHADT